MLDPLWREHIDAQVRTGQIIVAALAGGCLSFAAVAVVIRSGGAAPVGAVPIITFAGLAVAVAAVMARLVLGAILRGSFRKGLVAGQPPAPSIDDLHRLLQWLQVRTITGGALFEGAAFFLLIAYLVEGSVLSVVGAGLMVLGIAGHFPLPGRTVEWVENELDQAAQERRLGR